MQSNYIHCTSQLTIPTVLVLLVATRVELDHKRGISDLQHPPAATSAMDKMQYRRLKDEENKDGSSISYSHVH